VLGDILFERQSAGEIVYSGNKSDEARAMFLFFSNGNESNIGKAWHMPPRGSYTYELKSKKTDAKVGVESQRQIMKALEVVDSFTKEQLHKYKMGMFPQDYNHTSDDEVRLKLMKEARENPGRILMLDKDGDIEMNALITELEQIGLIVYTEKAWLWPGDDRKVLCGIKAGQKKLEALKLYLTKGKGVDILEQLENDLKTAKKNAAVPA
jgi:hypothetical protein